MQDLDGASPSVIRFVYGCEDGRAEVDERQGDTRAEREDQARRILLSERSASQIRSRKRRRSRADFSVSISTLDKLDHGVERGKLLLTGDDDILP